MKKRFLYLIIPIITLVLESLPYGAVCIFATSPTERVTETFSYFDLTPFGYSTDPEYVFYMDSVDNIKEEVNINGMPGEIFITPSEEETNTIVWGDASIPVMFSFTAEDDNETMIKVAENIKVIEVEDED